MEEFQTPPVINSQENIVKTGLRRSLKNDKKIFP